MPHDTSNVLFARAYAQCKAGEQNVMQEFLRSLIKFVSKQGNQRNPTQPILSFVFSPRTPHCPWQLAQLCWVQNNLHIMRAGKKSGIVRKNCTSAWQMAGNGKQEPLDWMAVAAVAWQWLRTPINYLDVLFLSSLWHVEYATLKWSSKVYGFFLCLSFEWCATNLCGIWVGNWLFYSSFYCGLSADRESAESIIYAKQRTRISVAVIRIMVGPSLRPSECLALWGDAIKLILKHFELNHSCW